MLLMQLMRSTPGFWMRPTRPDFPCIRPVLTGSITITQLSIGRVASPFNPIQRVL